VTWVDVQAGDFNGDGKIDIAGRVADNGQWWVGLSSGRAFNNSLWMMFPQSPSFSWLDVMAADFNGDGFTDIAGRRSDSGAWFVGLSNGSSLFNLAGSAWTNWAPNIAWVGVQHGAFV